MGKAYFCDVGHGDCTIIQGNSATFLVDCHEIHRYAHLLPASKVLQGVFITHQHRDHYSGMQFLKDKGYSIVCLIYSPYQRRYDDASAPLDEWNEFNSLRDYFVARGTKTWTPHRQENFNERFWNAGDVSFEILAPFSALTNSPTRELHDGCLVVGVYANQRRFLITGDASDSSLNMIARNTNNYCNDLLRASHHGSLNGADEDFIKGANAAYTVISTKNGVFPSVPHPTALQRYQRHTREKVFRTDQGGTVESGF